MCSRVLPPPPTHSQYSNFSHYFLRDYSIFPRHTRPTRHQPIPLFSFLHSHPQVQHANPICTVIASFLKYALSFLQHQRVVIIPQTSLQYSSLRRTSHCNSSSFVIPRFHKSNLTLLRFIASISFYIFLPIINLSQSLRLIEPLHFFFVSLSRFTKHISVIRIAWIITRLDNIELKIRYNKKQYYPRCNTSVLLPNWK